MGCGPWLKRRPSRRQLLRVESKLISQIQRPASECGVKVEFLMAFSSAVPLEFSSAQVVHDLVMPQTESWRTRYVDVTDPSLVGRANYYVCHNLQAPFQQLVSAVRQRFFTPSGEPLPETADAYLWIDIFAVNHHMLGPKEEYEQLPQILAGCHSTLLCMDARCCVMTRLFVLYEIWATLEAAKESGGDHPKLEVLTRCADTRYLKNEMLRLDVRTACLMRDLDRNFVLDMLMARGVKRVNRAIRQALADGARIAARQVTQPQSDEFMSLADEDPLAAVHVLHVCALIIQYHGRYADALAMLKQAVELWRNSPGGLGPASLQLLMQYAELLLLMKQWVLAKEVSEEALSLSHIALPNRRHSAEFEEWQRAQRVPSYSTNAAAALPQDRARMVRVPEPLGLHTAPDVACSVLLGRAYLGLGQNNRAEDLIRGALDRQQHKLARLAAHLSAKLMPGRKRARAAAISKGGHGRDSRGRRGTGGGGSADAAKTVVALADVMRLRGGYAVSEALALYFQASKALSRALGPKHVDVAYVQMRTAQLLYSQRKLEQAEQILRTVLEVYREAWGEEHPETASVVIALVGVELARLGSQEYDTSHAEHQSALQKATRQYMQAFEIRRVSLGPQHQDTLFTLAAATVQLVNSATTRVQLSRAEPMCRLAVKCSVSRQASVFKLIQHGEEEEGEGHHARSQSMNLVSNLHMLGSVLACAGKLEEATLIFGEAVAVAEAELPPGHQLHALCLLGQADVAHAGHDHTTAAVAYRKALAIYNSLLSLHMPVAPPRVGPVGGAIRTSLARISAGVSHGLQRMATATRRTSEAGDHRFSMDTPFGGFAGGAAAPNRFSLGQSPSMGQTTSLGQQPFLALPPSQKRQPSDTSAASAALGTASLVLTAGGLQTAQSDGAAVTAAGGDGSSLPEPLKHQASSGVTPRGMSGTDIASGLQGGSSAPAGTSTEASSHAGRVSSTSASVQANGPAGMRRAVESISNLVEAEERRDVLTSLHHEARKPHMGMGAGERAPWLASAALGAATALGGTGVAGGLSGPQLQTQWSNRSQSQGGLTTAGSAGLTTASSGGGPLLQPSSSMGQLGSSAGGGLAPRGSAPLPNTTGSPASPTDMGNTSMLRTGEDNTTSNGGKAGAGAGTISGPGASSFGADRISPQRPSLTKANTFAARGSVGTPLNGAAGGKAFSRQPSDGGTHGGQGERTSAIGRLARAASARLVAAFSSAGGDAAEATAKHAKMADLSIQMPKVGDTTVGPHQVILQLGRRELAAVRPVLYMRQESVVCLNNLALLLRWTQGFAEAEVLLRRALELLEPQPLPIVAAKASGVGTHSGELASPRTTVDGRVSLFKRKNSGGKTLAAAPGSAAADLVNASTHMVRDPRLSHIRALIMSNLGGLLASQGRFGEGLEVYTQALKLCATSNRAADAMIIAINILQLYLCQGLEEQALELARIAITPQLSVMFGPGASGSMHGNTAYAAFMAAANAAPGAPPQVVSRAGPAGASAAPSTSWSLRQQLVEALAARVVDDGGHVLYQWAAEALAVQKHQQSQQQQSGAKPQPGAGLRIPETCFMLQAPGIHMHCIHMMRWLLVVDGQQVGGHGHLPGQTHGLGNPAMNGAPGSAGPASGGATKAGLPPGLVPQLSSLRPGASQGGYAGLHTGGLSHSGGGAANHLETLDEMERLTPTELGVPGDGAVGGSALAAQQQELLEATMATIAELRDMYINPSLTTTFDRPSAVDVANVEFR